MKRAFRKYHRTLGLIVCLPLALTILSGMAITMVSEWQLDIGLTHSLLYKLHTGEIFHLQKIYPLLNGLGCLGLLITGLSMSNLFRRTAQKG